MRVTRRHAIAVGSAAAVALALWLYPSHRLGRDRLLVSERIPQIARALLQKRMERHGETLSELMYRLVLFDYDAVRTEAQHIREEAPLARPLTGDATELNSALPERFFEWQDELRARALDVEHAAQGGNSQKLLDGYLALAKTCMGCHRLYLEGDK